MAKRMENGAGGGGGNLAKTARLSEYDFRCHMPSHKFIYLENGDLWPASSVNKRVPPILVGYDEAGDPIYVSAANWIAEHLPVEQMTWFPGLPTIIHDRLMIEGGLVDAPGNTIYNLYRPPPVLPGDPNLATLWVNHVRHIYPTDAEHILDWLAHRVQHPEENCNHSLVLVGSQGIGKDTILYPVIQTIGTWNHAAISPTVLLGRFNGYLKTVLLQINEGRDLGDVDRYAFYEHCKPIIAAPPEFLRIDEKNRPEYPIPNLCGVVIGSNYLTDGLYLAEDDRRHYVAASEAIAEDMLADNPNYFVDLYKWFDEGGTGHVGAFLQSRDLSGFDPKAPPPRTPAFWQIVNAEEVPERSALRELIDEMGHPAAVTIKKLIAKTQQDSALETWLKEPKNRRQIPKNMNKAGYVDVPNPDAKDGVWRVNGKRTPIYARRDLTVQQRLVEARKLTE